MKKPKVIFLYAHPHPIHKAWADTVTDEHYRFVPKITTRGFVTSAISSQLLALLKTPFIPKANIYLAEDMVCILPAILKKRKKDKIFVINASTFFYRYEKSKGIIKKIYDLYLKHVDGFISDSEFMGDFVERNTEIPNISLDVPMVNKSFFEHEADLDSRTIGHGLSALTYSKGTDILVKAFRKVKRRLKGYNLLLIGPKGKDLQMLDNLDNKSDINMTGWTTQPETDLKQCGLYVNSARFEPFGMNILEAMAEGIPPISTSRCGASHIVKKISPKLVVEPRAKDIAEAIIWLESDKARKKNLGKKAKILAKEFSEKQKPELFTKAFEELSELSDKRKRLR